MRSLFERMSEAQRPAPTNDDVDDAVTEWHMRGDGALHDWLGWSFEEYAAWVRSPEKIPARPLRWSGAA